MNINCLQSTVYNYTYKEISLAEIRHTYSRQSQNYVKRCRGSFLVRFCK